MKKCTLILLLGGLVVAAKSQLVWRHAIDFYTQQTTSLSVNQYYKDVAANPFIVGQYDSAHTYTGDVPYTVPSLRSTLTKTTTWTNAGLAIDGVSTSSNVYFHQKIGGSAYIACQNSPYIRKLNTATSMYEASGPSGTTSAKRLYDWGGSTVLVFGGYGSWNVFLWNTGTNTVSSITSTTGTGTVPLLSIADWVYTHDTLYVAGMKNATTASIVYLPKGATSFVEALPTITANRLFKLLVVNKNHMYMLAQVNSNKYELHRLSGGWTKLSETNVWDANDVYGISGAAIDTTTGTMYYSGRFTTVNGETRSTGIVGYDEVTNTSWDLAPLLSAEGMYSPNVANGSPVRGMWFIDGKVQILNIGLAPTGVQSILMLTTPPSLPIHLLSFNAVRQVNNIVVTWHTTNEINVDHFEIERSTNGTNFKPIGTIPATNTVNHTYQWNDFAPVSGTSFYRLKTIDKNSTTSYSLVVKISSIKSAFGIVVYPNPVRDHASVAISDDKTEVATITLSSVDGKTISTMQATIAAGTTTIPLTTKLHKGTYIVSISTPTNTVLQKIVKE